MADRRAGPSVARRPGDLARHQSDPLSGRRLDAERRGAGRWPARYPLALHGFARFETFAVEILDARLRPADPSRQCAHARGLSVRLRARGRIPARCRVARDRDRSRQSRREGRPLRLRAPPGLPLAARRGRTRWRSCAVREGGAARGSAPRAGRARQQTKRPIPLQGRDLKLTDELFAHDALCFLDCASRSLAFIDASGASITMEYPGFPHAALWTRPGAPFLCLEAWTGYSDPDGFEGELSDKPSMRVLEPGERARHEARFVFRRS